MERNGFCVLQRYGRDTEHCSGEKSSIFSPAMNPSGNLYPKNAPNSNLFLLLLRYASSGGNGKEESVMSTPKKIEEKNCGICVISYCRVHITLHKYACLNLKESRYGTKSIY